MGVNNSWMVYKPMLWTCADDPGNFADVGWKDPSITKFAPLAHIPKKLQVKEENGTFRQSQFSVSEMPSVLYFRRNGKFNPDTFLTENTVNWGMKDKEADGLGFTGGRSVMLQAIKLLYYLGFRTVYLLGADFKMEVGKQNYAFQQDRSADSVKGNNKTYQALNARFDAMSSFFAEKHYKVFNCYKESGLTSFPHISFEDAVAQASKECSKTVDTEGWYDRKKREEMAAKNDEKAVPEAPAKRRIPKIRIVNPENKPKE